jgi:hypothetical protein
VGTGAPRWRPVSIQGVESVFVTGTDARAARPSSGP